MSAYVGEFLGTFVLVFVITLVVTLFVNPQGTGSDFAVSGLAQGLVLFMLVATLGRVTGGHFNPAVTVTAAVLRKISPMDALMYVLVQLIGAICGAFMTYFILIDELAKQANVGAASLNLSLLGSTTAGMVAEALGTFFLVWAVVGMAMNPKAPKDWAPLTIGLTFGFIVMILGPLTGAAVNPARWFGPALVSEVAGGVGFTNVWVYLIGDFAGGLLGGVTYWYLFVDSKDSAPTGQGPAA
jgi:MIP family channel proteins